MNVQFSQIWKPDQLTQLVIKTTMANKTHDKKVSATHNWCKESVVNDWTVLNGRAQSEAGSTRSGMLIQLLIWQVNTESAGFLWQWYTTLTVRYSNLLLFSRWNSLDVSRVRLRRECSAWSLPASNLAFCGEAIQSNDQKEFFGRIFHSTTRQNQGEFWLCIYKRNGLKQPLVRKDLLEKNVTLRCHQRPHVRLV